MGIIISVNRSKEKGVPKRPIARGTLVPGLGLKGDAHAQPGERQVSLLMIESIRAFQDRRGTHNVASDGVMVPGTFAENLTTKGIDLSNLCIGDELVIGKKVRLRVTCIGKRCHTRCGVYKRVGDCIMPSEGIFCEVLQGGSIARGDTIEIVRQSPSS